VDRVSALALSAGLWGGSRLWEAHSTWASERENNPAVAISKLRAIHAAIDMKWRLLSIRTAAPPVSVACAPGAGAVGLRPHTFSKSSAVGGLGGFRGAVGAPSQVEGFWPWG